ncbi:tripartite tricarboxylate transporter substrate binding protein [Achromobacter deleyi]|uniref:Tripartite tricarboxylate transporter substrate binding protein n=1 Tax=Achromobacter deleyi TaxID=1353891 RepID=A0A7T4B5E2_9BURK|nr:tripartite tricarboxylate transporter substrate binding protein [Achromobacter deleyi]QQB36026.1 tripartite tricarboxylate transporter substrate binding protein [Achromobacter deleyi]
MYRPCLAVLATASLLFAAAPAVRAQPAVSTHAGAYPDKPITLLIPYPPGGSADMLARPLGAALQKKWNQPVVLEYKPGAGGAIASSQLARARPDGYTLLMVLAAHAINPSLYPSLPYDTRRDFAPVSLVATLPMLVSAPLSTPANDIPELIAYARQHPGKLSFASAGNGNTSHLAAEMFKHRTGTDMLHVPYKGSGPAVVALLGGEVSLMFDSISTSLPQVQSGKLKALAVTGEHRSPLLPNVPTVAEAVPGFVVNGWYGILAPANTPPAILDTLSSAIAAAINTPDLKAQLNSYGYETVGSTPAAFADHIAKELDTWKQAVEVSGAKLN